MIVRAFAAARSGGAGSEHADFVRRVCRRAVRGRGGRTSMAENTIKVVTDPAALLLKRLMRLLRWRLWIQEKLQRTEWQVTLLWAALAGFVGALASSLFAVFTEGTHQLLTGHTSGVVETMRQLPWWARIVVPAAGGLLAGLTLLLGKLITRGQSSTDYMEAIVIGSGRLPVRSSLVRCAAALFSIGS